MRDLLFSHIADVTQKPRSVILMEIPPQRKNEMENKYPLPIIKTKHC